ncbi:glycosyltransferase family 2 protein [Chryseobacterium foetidum]|uniref:glycosyltransferase family 2 protein n=1 Tax=Chryseobacterium foetidum TaxID=2951057 RepID=UPI0021CA955F|nr:glycosyltransferase family A protein [Chryseobacterium foetidum]
MVTNSLVSIIVLCYNSESFIIETLESIKNQSYENIELIISDDHSKDKSIEVCSNWLKQNTERFVASQIITVPQNSGIPANCNRGVKAAKGAFLKLIAGDDLLTPDCILDNFNFALKNPAANIIISEMDAFLDGTEPKKILERKKPFGNIFHADDTAEDQNRFLVQTSYFGNAPALFYRKSVFDKVDFDESIPLLEDYPFAIIATKAGFKYEYLPALTVLYRVREDSAYFKNNAEIFGRFYQTKFQFDQKYRHSHLDFISLNNEIFYHKVLSFFDRNDLNKNKPINRTLYKIAHLLNPFRYLFFLRQKVSYSSK